MDTPALTDEASQQLMLIAQRDETKKIFNIPPGSFLEEIIDQGNGFENHDSKAADSNPAFVHQRIFRAGNVFGDGEKTVIVETLRKDKLTKTTFSILKMTSQNTAVNRFDITYSHYSDGAPSVVTVNVVPSNHAHGIAFDLNSQNQISYIDDTTRALRQPTADINKTPLELRLFDGMRIDGFKADAGSLTFQMRAFPTPESQPLTVNLPRVLGR